MKLDSFRTAWPWPGLFLMLALVLIVSGTVAAQEPPDIIAGVSPTSATQGGTGVTVTITLESQSPPTPPMDATLLGVSIGPLEATTFNRDALTQVTALFDIPVDTPTGPHDVSLSFEGPGGDPLTFTEADAFEILPAGPSQPLSIGKTVEAIQVPVQLGDAITYTVVVTNSGDDDALGVRVADTLPEGLIGNDLDWTGAIPAGGEVTFVLPAQVTTNSTYAGRAILNTAFYSHTTGSGEASAAFRIAGAFSYVVVDTDQVTCYDDAGEIACPAPDAPFYGQDAQHTGYSPAYVDNGDGTVTDMNTGLVWQQSTDSDGDGDIDADDKFTHVESETYCQDLALAGHADWRLPNIKELYSLIQFSGTDPSGCATVLDCPDLVPFIDTDYFAFGYGDTDAGERVIDAQYASSSLYVADPNKLFGVNLADGRIKGYDLTMPGGGAKTFYAQCVRGAADYGENDLVDNSDGTITDQATGLMWAQADNGTGLNWEEALAWVETQNAANYLGYDDWRLPDAKELQSILDYSRSPDSSGSAAIDSLFGVTEIVNEGGEVDYPYYWTSTTHARYSGSGEAGAYVAFGRALGWMQLEGQSCYTLIDVHGAGAQRSDHKSGSPFDYYLGPACSGGSAYGHGPQGDILRIDNYVRLVRDAEEACVPLESGTILGETDGLPGTYTFDAAYTPVSATLPISYTWDNGDTGSSSSRNLGVGVHTLALTSTNCAVTLVDTHTITITEESSCNPMAGVTLTLVTTDTMYAGDTAEFSADVSPDDAGKPYTYTRYVGGQTLVYPMSSSDDPLEFSHAFPNTGTFSVEIRVWNCDMSEAEAVVDSVEVTVYEPEACVDLASVDLSLLTTGDVYPGDQVDLRADLAPAGASLPYSYTIDYGDGSAPVDGSSSADPFNFNYTYAATGTYTVTFEAWNCDMTGPLSDTVQVVVSQPAIEGYVIYLPLVIRTAPLPVPASAASLGPQPRPHRRWPRRAGRALLPACARKRPDRLGA